MSRKAIRKRTPLEEWQEVRLGDVCSFFSGGTPSRSNPGYYEGNIPFIGSGDIKCSSVNQFITERALRNSSAKLVRKGDLLYALYGATSGETAISKMDGAINQAVLCIQTEENKEFIYNYLLMQKKYILKTYLQGGQGNLSAHIVKSLRILLPPLPEQQAIAETLQTWDTAIEKTENLITEKETQFGWFRQKVLTGEVRFKNFSLPWELQEISGLLTEHKLTSNGNEEIHSVSVHKGVINQIEHMGRSFSASKTNHYHLVNPGDLVYTRSPTGDFPLGIIKQSKLEISVIVSPLYAVFKPRTIELGNFLDAYFESPKNTTNYLNPVVQRGAKNTISCKSSAFLSRKLFLPTDTKEIQSISGYIDTAKKEIDLLKQAAEQYRTQKYGLMQKLLSGKLRIEV